MPNILSIRPYKLFTAALRYACVIVVIPLFFGCFGNGKTANVDSSQRHVPVAQDTTKKQSHMPPAINEEAMQKAVISMGDSIFHVYNNIRADYRIIGYESPDTNSRKMVLFSVFTSDVKDNPYDCPYGSYYDSGQANRVVIKYTGEQESFIVATISGESKKTATVYFEKKWVEFDKLKISEAKMDKESIAFAKYAVETDKLTEKAKLNFNSNPGALHFKSRIINAYNSSKVNFAGHYIGIAFGCGGGCIMGFIVDVKDGKIYDAPLGEENMCIWTIEMNIYKPNSRLYISSICKEESDSKDVFYKAYVWDEKGKVFNKVDGRGL